MMVSNKTIKTLGFDADDTLWVNEPLYTAAEEKLKHLLSRYVGPEAFRKRLYETEIGNLHVFGYGAKSFTLSMIEVAVELSSGSISGSEIQQIIDKGLFRDTKYQRATRSTRACFHAETATWVKDAVARYMKLLISSST